MVELQGELDRRSLLKVGAVAGTMAWVAPTIAAQPAWAAACTPKCIYPEFTLDVTVQTYCPGGGRKWAILTLQPPEGLICPCDSPLDEDLVPNELIEVCFKPPALWTKDGATDGIAITTPPPGGAPIGPLQFVVKKEIGDGSLGDGLWTSDEKLVYAIGCRDESGDKGWRICDFTLSFDFQPGGGNCAQGAGAGNGTAVRGTCVTACLEDCPIDVGA
jgi:hypothetical protein